MDATGKRYARSRDSKPLGPTDWKWFLTPTSIRQYMAMIGDDSYDRSMKQLGKISLVARLMDKEGRSGCSYYRCKITLNGKRKRVTMVVMPPIRKEGTKPQLVRITFN